MLSLGAVAGLVMAAQGALTIESPGQLFGSPTTIVSVNGKAIRWDDYTLRLESLAADKRNPITQADEARVLERLVDEELLVQRGNDIGLVDSDISVRKAIISAMIQYILSDAGAEVPDEEVLRSFYDKNRDFFAPAARARVERLYIRQSDDPASDERRIDEVIERLAAGDSFGAVAETLGDPILPEIPNATLPPAKLREYLGPTLTEAALSIQPGVVAGPIDVSSGYHFLRVTERIAAEPKPFTEVAEQVRAEYERRADEEALAGYLDWLRSDADLLYAESAPR